jgi:hypothetical protein
VKLIQAYKDGLVFELPKWEKQLFFAILNLYPLIPPAHQVLSKTGKLPDVDANQRLLNDALAEQRAQNKQQVQALLADPQRFKDSESGCQLRLSVADVEWLLQVFNDIRVGSWILLGSPDKKPDLCDEHTTPHFWALEMGDHFQMSLLEAVASMD